MMKVPHVYRQFFAIISCNLLTLSFGFISGFATIYFNDFENKNSTFPAGRLTKDELKYAITLEKIGGLGGNFGIVILMQLVGVKRSIHSLSLLLITSSLFTIWAQNLYHLCIARALNGFTGGAIIVAIPSMINDISCANVRGALNSIYDPLNNFGVFVSFLLGSYLGYREQAKLQWIVPMIFIIIMFLFPESPVFLANKNKETKAIKSRKFYKGNIKELELKLENDQIEENQKTCYVNREMGSNSKLRLNDFLTPHAKRAFFISFTPLALSFISGSSVIINYATAIFKTTGSSLTDKDSALILPIVQIIANILMLGIVERFNRKTLYIWSSLLTASSYFLFGVYCWFWIKLPAYEWIPPFCFACIVFFSCLGLLPIPYIITTEVFPKKIRQACLSLALSCMWIVLAVLDLILPEFFDSHTLLCICMFTFGVVCLINAIFGIYCIPETRGKSFEKITQMLSK